MKNVLKNLGTIWHFALSQMFERENFSYSKILSIHLQYTRKNVGSALQKDPFITLLPYKGIVREMIWSYKFKNNKELSRYFGLLLYEFLPGQLIEWEQFDGFDNPLLVSVPSSKKRLHERGFDHNHLILRRFLAEGGSSFVEYRPHVIKKIKHTQKQSWFSNKAERMRNPNGAFAVANAPLLKNRNILLFDDIYTTGATVSEVIKVLKESGAKQIKIVVLAH